MTTLHRRHERRGDGLSMPEATALLTILRLSIGEAVTKPDARLTAAVLGKAWNLPEESVLRYLDALVRLGRSVREEVAA